MTLAARLEAVRGQIAAACAAAGREPVEVTLLPVSKRHPEAVLREAIAAGLSVFGENRVQELAAKAEALGDEPVAWHLIGSLQTNKVRRLLSVPRLALVHSLDRERLADALQEALADCGRRLEVLLQIDATGDATKHGVRPAEAVGLLRHVRADCPALQVTGVMAMGPLAGDPAPVFREVARVHRELREASGLPLPIRSMGMTGDLAVAIANGSTLVRVGTAIFGARP